jgi:peptidoglycan hydrolase-like protein with peptidoglycan-binding domain
MKPVRPGSRGPAVEDIQRRLLGLGYDLGPTGVDGVFLGKTTDAVRSFQRAQQLSEDGEVGEETWSALVDASFTFGDRMLYLRMPHFHGQDVRLLQQALNALGFACGETDGIFGAFTERAVREFQRNAGLPHDGIVGPGTARTIGNLKHVWEGKDGRPHSEAHAAPARKAEVLARVDIMVLGEDELGEAVAERVVNLALATTDRARLHVPAQGEAIPAGGVLFRLCEGGTKRAMPGRPQVRLADPNVVVTRLVTALATMGDDCREIVLEIVGEGEPSDVESQRSAVRVLDAICSAFD